MIGKSGALAIALVTGVPHEQPACVNTLSEPRALRSGQLVFRSGPNAGAATLVKEIEAHQRKMDELCENYTFNEVTLTDELVKSFASYTVQ
jgi:hypothetical protein